MKIQVVKEAYHTQCVVFVFNKWGYQIPTGVRQHDNTNSIRNLSYTMCSVRVQKIVIPNTYCLRQK